MPWGQILQGPWFLISARSHAIISTNAIRAAVHQSCAASLAKTPLGPPLVRGSPQDYSGFYSIGISIFRALHLKNMFPVTVATVVFTFLLSQHRFASLLIYVLR